MLVITAAMAKQLLVITPTKARIVFSLVDALVGKKKLKDALSGVLTEVK